MITPWKLLSHLSAGDLQAHAIWVLNESEGDVGLVRPATRECAENSNEVYLVRSRFILCDRTEQLGYCSPQDSSGMDYVQPVIIVSGKHLRFWCEDPAEASAESAEICRVLDRPLARIFPISFVTDAPCDGTYLKGRLERVYSRGALEPHILERSRTP
jgi:hypothetical protein